MRLVSILLCYPQSVGRVRIQEAQFSDGKSLASLPGARGSLFMPWVV